MRPYSLVRLLRLTLLVVSGLLTVLLRFPSMSAAERDRRVVDWAGRFLATLNVRVTLHGHPPDVHRAGALLVANHISWLDMPLLHSLAAFRFVSKSEVRDWPVVGRLARATGTLFLERNRKADTLRVNREMGEVLRSGDCLALFPEGTTSDGRGLLPFYPGLLQPAIEADAPVWPVAIRYRHPDGRPNPEVAYCGDIRLSQSLRRVLALPEIRVEVHFLPPLRAAGRRRRELAREAEAAIRAVLADGGHGSPPETGARPPV